MAKGIAGGIQPGSQATALQENNVAGLKLPVTQVQEDMPQAQTSLEAELEAALSAQGEAPVQGASPTMGMFNEGEFDQIETQQENPMLQRMGMSPEETAYQVALDTEAAASQQILPIQDRGGDKRVRDWDISPMSSLEADGGLTQRAAKIRKDLRRGSSTFQGTTAAVSSTTDFTRNSTIGKLATAMNAVDYDIESGSFAPNDMFTKIMTIYAEDYFASKTLGKDGSEETDSANMSDAAMFGEGVKRPQQTEIKTEFLKRQDDPRKLGQQIYKEYQRSLGTSEDQVTPIDDKNAAILGDYAKEVYAKAAGPENIQRTVDSEGGKSAVKFSLSGQMITKLQSSQAFRDKMLPRKFVRPSSVPTRGGRVETDQAELTRRISGQVAKGPITSREIEEAMDNSGSIANVVRPERMKILFSTVLPALAHRPEAYGSDPIMDLFADLNTFGPKKLQAYQAEQKIQLENGNQYSAEMEIQKLKNNVAQNVLGVAMERKGAKYFQYFMQAFNGRLTPQASLFNPTTSKAVRFVTSNAVPTIIKPASLLEEAAWQAYSLVIGSKGTDALIPKRRKQAMLLQSSQLEAWGDRLSQVMANSMTDAEAEAIAEAITNGVAMNDPSFPQVKPMGLDPEIDANLIQAIKDKGDDGLAYIDGLIDFAKFRKAMKAGRPYASYLNPTIDGKTNGPASNGMQMGDERIAYRTGVLRTEDSLYAVDENKDIRDVLKDILLASVEQGLQGHFPDPSLESMISEAMKEVFSYRDLNKAITMTFGYGKDFPSFIPDIEDAIAFLSEGNSDYNSLIQALETQGYSRRDLAELMLAQYVPAVTQVMSEEGILARHLLWGTALAHSLAGIPIEIVGPTGLRIVLGGMSPDESISAGTYKIQGEQRRAMMYEGKPTAAAIRYRVDADGQPVEDVGGKAWGGIIPAPVQAIDAATVVKTFSGASWKKISQATNNKPYIHQIYDAFKFDIATYAVAAEEVNNNWAKVSLNWSYLRESEKALDRAIDSIKAQLESLPEGPVDLSQLPMLADLLSDSEVRTAKTGKPYRVFPKLLAKIRKMTPYTDLEQTERWAMSTHFNIVGASGLRDFSNSKPSISKSQVRAFYNSLFKSTGLKSRLKAMADRTDKKKAILAKKVMSKDNPIYQYYAH